PRFQAGGILRRGIFGGRELQLQRGQRLSQAVVNLARDPGALILADVLLPRGETPERGARGAQLLIGALGFRDVADGPQIALLAADLDPDEREEAVPRGAAFRADLELDIA